MSKKLSVLMAAILSLSMMLVGCKSESPTDVVNTYFTQLKKGDSEEASKFIEETISETEEETGDKAAKEKTDEALKIYLSKMDAKVLSEKVDGDNATVEVELSSLNFGNMLIEVMQEGLADAFSGKEVDDDYMSKSLLEKVKSGKVETRTGKVNLTKKDKVWTIKSDDDILTLMLGKAKLEDNSTSK
ncbi:DUF4878 domain-containing protein [Terrisporobacter glycolicus]|uniref:DUF4878 domain-containing protein n=1 Tax=Terrisporobacter glycolicus ATCC 14880 = DSM 1288 TaxID=1121315 RepID=A0ABZ2ETN6_9FIRM|nr:DUF4878 domain-containing protein [Terrisporobacter glycolicus]